MAVCSSPTRQPWFVRIMKLYELLAVPIRVPLPAYTDCSSFGPAGENMVSKSTLQVQENAQGPAAGWRERRRRWHPDDPGQRWDPPDPEPGTPHAEPRSWHPGSAVLGTAQLRRDAPVSERTIAGTPESAQPPSSAAAPAPRAPSPAPPAPWRQLDAARHVAAVELLGHVRGQGCHVGLHASVHVVSPNGPFHEPTDSHLEASICEERV